MRAILLAATILAPLLPHPAAAQPADPPSRVGRVSRVEGTVSYRLGTDPAWRPAVVNLPVTTGAALWTEPGASADLGVGETHLALDAQTELDVSRLDDHEMDITAPQGALCLHPSALTPGDTYVVQTPRGTVQVSATGRYEIVAGDTANPTTVTVLDGAAQVTGTTFNLLLQANQTATIDGDGASTPFRTSLGPARRSAFLDACLARERPPSRNRPAAVAHLTGAEALDEYGTWAPNPQYGSVWFPPDAPDYVPFRAGRWDDVAPWGWTWVDDAPWGFAPSHYGRWAQVGGRWGWIAPGRSVRGYERPVYAPAVVAFLAGAAFGAAVADRPVGWVPLGPGEPYYPPYRASGRYVGRLNQPNVRNVTDVVQTYNSTVINAGTLPRVRGGFANARAATVVPEAALAAGQQIAPVARPIPPDALGGAALVRPPADASRATFTPSPGPAVTGAPPGVRPPLRRLNGEPGAPPEARPFARPSGGPGAAGIPGVPSGVFPLLRAPGAGRPVEPTGPAAPPGEPPIRPNEPPLPSPTPRPPENRPGLPAELRGATPPVIAPEQRRSNEPIRPGEGPRPEAPRIAEPPRPAAPAPLPQLAAPAPRPTGPQRPETPRPLEPPHPVAPAPAPQAPAARPAPPPPARLEPFVRPMPPPAPPPVRAPAPIPQIRPAPPPPPQAAPPQPRPQPPPPQPRPAPPALPPPQPRPAPPPPQPAPQPRPAPAPPPPQPRPAAPPPHPGPHRPGEPG